MAAARSRDRHLDRKTAAQLVSEDYFPLSKRGIERWPLPGKLINGRVHVRESDVRAHARTLLDHAPAVAAPKLRRER